MSDVRPIANRLRGVRGDKNLLLIAEALEALQAQYDLIAQAKKGVLAEVKQTAEDTASTVGDSLTPGKIEISSAGTEFADPNDFGQRLEKIWAQIKVLSGTVTRVAFYGRKYGETGTPEYIGESSLSDAGYGLKLVFVMVQPPSTSTAYDIWICAGNQSTMSGLDEDTTPHWTIQLDPVPAGSGGAEYCAAVSGFTLQPYNDGHVVNYRKDSSGVQHAYINPTWTTPSDAQFAGVDLVEQKPNSVYEIVAHLTQPMEVQLWCPPSVESHTIWAPSYNKQGKRNTLSGACPKYGPFNIGSASGTLDLGKALAQSVGSAMEVVNGVLGVGTGGITSSMIQNFAISKAKLANAPIIDAVRIENGAIETAHIQNAAITNALIHDVAASKITAGELAAGVIYAGEINASQLKAGTANIGGTLTITGGTLDADDGMVMGDNSTCYGNFTVVGVVSAASYKYGTTSGATQSVTVLVPDGGGGYMESTLVFKGGLYTG